MRRKALIAMHQQCWMSAQQKQRNYTIMFCVGGLLCRPFLQVVEHDEHGCVVEDLVEVGE